MDEKRGIVLRSKSWEGSSVTRRPTGIEGWMVRRVPVGTVITNEVIGTWDVGN